MRSTRSSGIHPSSIERSTVLGALAPLLGSAAVALFALPACLDRPICSDCNPRTTNIFAETVDPKSVTAIDLLFMIDNSASMADKQAVLAEAVPDLVKRLVQPNCVVKDTGEIQARGADGKCPAGAPQEFDPVEDIHIGVITSSLGAHGADNQCDGSAVSDPVGSEEVDDHGHLLGTRPRFLSTGVGGGPAPLLAAQGFLNWNPESVPGQTVDALSSAFQTMTTRAGESGCGYEAQLESVYRFLVDPAPYDKITLGACGQAICARPEGIDRELLNERAAFLRPNSLVAVMLLTDENDCSIRDSGQGYIAGDLSVDRNGNTAMYKASSICATNPNDRCCYSCGQTAPSNCPPEPNCGRYKEDEDDTNLRCFEQQRRFGFDFLYPTARYVNALQKRQICTSRADVDATDPSQCPDLDEDGNPDVVSNPLFLGGRSATSVFLAGILGVPWQDIQAKEKPDGTGTWPDGELHYMTAKQLEEGKIWDRILGNPHPPDRGAPILPLDGLMVESTMPRAGTDVNGKLIPGPNAALSETNGINGHDWNAAPSDLEYACIFPLPRDGSGKNFRTCSDDLDSNCDCTPPGIDGKSPLCQNPATGEYGHDQYYAKAYPGLRELSVLQDFGDNAIVASICARNLEKPSDPNTPVAQDYGYRPAVDALVDRLKDQLTGRCLPRRLEKNPDGQYPCAIIEANPAGGSCDPGRGRLDPRSTLIAPTREKLTAIGFCGGPDQAPCDSVTLCELQEAGPECHQATETQPVAGWCYVDPDANGSDDPNLVSNCPANRRRIINFVDPKKATPAPGSRVIIACAGADLAGAN
ncbi:MAG TPA: hypothetical protein VHE30_24175 [Polyangiaceae bacterium]|nr:hypothetical protein [Polyangiaceae bacterium]